MTGGSIDPDVVRRHLAALREAASHLQRHARVTASELRADAGFRNVMVLGYLQVDLAIVEGVLRDRLPDFEAFARYVEEHLEK